MPMPPGLAAKRAALAFWMSVPRQGALFLGVSGGVDSMVLLHSLCRFCPEKKARQRLFVVHVNHGLRASESDADEELVRTQAGALGLRFRSFRLEWPEGKSPSQDDCRRERDRIFKGLCRKPGDRIVLAHHLNDQAETVLFRLIRGTGLKGLKGMEPASERKLRPFLGIEKSDLLGTAAEWGVSWREDSSNQSAEYERNWIRTLFPLIEERRPGFQAKLAALAEEARGLPPAAAIDRFVLGDSLEFARPTRGCGDADLHHAFGLGRLHTKSLRALLLRPSGELQAKGSRFRWSAGLLLVEKGERFAPSLSVSGKRKYRMESCLGRWECSPDLSAGLQTPASARGQSARKEFQSVRVPLFLRPAVPLLWTSRGPSALLPGRIEALGADIHYTPSPLACWWMKAKGG